MKLTDFYENVDYYNGISESQVINEDLSNVAQELHKRISQIMSYMNEGRNQEEVERMIQRFGDQYGKIYVALRSVLAVDQHLNKSDDPSSDESYKPTVVTMGALLTGSVAKVKKALMDFLAFAKKRSNKVLATITHFERVLEKDLQSKMKGSVYKGSAFIEEFQKNLDRIIGGSQRYVARYKEVTKAMGEGFDLGETIFESMYEFEKNGLLDTMDFQINESVEGKPNEVYFGLIKYYLVKTGAKQHSKVGYALVVSNKESAADAKKEIIKNSKSSAAKINKGLKGVRIAVSDNVKLYYGLDKIKNTNVVSIVGDKVYSKGLYTMKGFTDLTVSNVGKTVEHAPMPTAMLTTKSSLTRFINKNFGE